MSGLQPRWDTLTERKTQKARTLLQLLVLPLPPSQGSRRIPTT